MSQDENSLNPYSALLTLLNSGHKQGKKRKRQAEEPKATKNLVNGHQVPTDELTVDSNLQDIISELDGSSSAAIKNFDLQFGEHLHKLAEKIQKANVDLQWSSRPYSVDGLYQGLVYKINDTEGVPSRSPQLESQLKQKLLLQLSSIGPLTEFCHSFLQQLITYGDMLFTLRNTDNAADLRLAYALHCINHILRTRDRVIKNNARAVDNQTDGGTRDQGFTRPKVLVLLPTRHKCKQFIEAVLHASGIQEVANHKRFNDEFGVRSAETIQQHKPPEFRALFEGNHDDMFRIGVKVTRKNLKLFTPFYSSDLVVASPIGLATLGDNETYDFLSSIEICVIDEADAYLMQNWMHLETCLSKLNQMPKEAHDCDFSRVKACYLDGLACFFRQTILLSQFSTPDINSVFSRYMRNVGGKFKTTKKFKGLLESFAVNIRQTFQRVVAAATPKSTERQRLGYFEKNVLQPLQYHADPTGTLLVVPSDIELSSARRMLEKTNVDAVYISEYTGIADVTRARNRFFRGETPVLVYTERIHHFRRYNLRGVRRIIMYSPVENPIFYKEMVNFLVNSVLKERSTLKTVTCIVLFTTWDFLKLERIVGTARINNLLHGAGDLYHFH